MECSFNSLSQLILIFNILVAKSEKNSHHLLSMKFVIEIEH